MNENRKEREEKKNKSNQIASRFEFYPMRIIYQCNYGMITSWKLLKKNVLNNKCITLISQKFVFLTFFFAKDLRYYYWKLYEFLYGLKIKRWRILFPFWFLATFLLPEWNSRPVGIHNSSLSYLVGSAAVVVQRPPHRLRRRHSSGHFKAFRPRPQFDSFMLITRE